MADYPLDDDINDAESDGCCFFSTDLLGSHGAHWTYAIWGNQIFLFGIQQIMKSRMFYHIGVLILTDNFGHLYD